MRVCEHEWKESHGRGHTYVTCRRCHAFPPSHLRTLERLAETESVLLELVVKTNELAGIVLKSGR